MILIFIEKIYVWFKNLWLNKYGNIKHIRDMHISLSQDRYVV